MASEHVADAEQIKPLEAKIADLNLQEKAGLAAGAAHEYVDGTKDAAKITVEQVKKDFTGGAEKVSEASKDSVEQVKKDFTGCAEKASEASKDGQEASPHDSSSREVQIAEKEMQQSPDDGAYVVPTVDHRSVEGSGGEEKVVDVPTAVVHENADSVDKPQQQGKGLIQSVTGKITNSVKSVFSGFTGGKAGKSPEAKINETKE